MGLSALAFLDKQIDPFGYILTVIHPHAAADQIAIHDTGFIDKDFAGDLAIKTAFGNGRHSPAFDTIRIRRDLHTVAYRCNGLVGFEKIAGDAHQIFILSDIFRRPASGKKDA